MQPARGATAEPPGWFGKVAMLGDFAHRRLPAEVVRRCDEWLSECIVASRQTLAQDWLDTYLSSPLWYFAWAPRIADASWWFGVLMPSVDAAGRYFPLVVCRDAQVSADPGALAQLADWYEAIGRCALATLQPAATLDAFEEHLAKTPALNCEASDALPAFVASNDDLQCADVPAESSSWLRHAPAIALRSVVQQLGGHSFWWPQLPASQPSRINLVRGLPAPAQFAAMLQGRL
jgi:type VI secretion system protein ImpM